MPPRFPALVALAFLTGALSAQDSGSRFHVSGFGTLGLALNSTREAEFGRDLSQPEGVRTRPSFLVDSRLGLQANLNLTEDLSVVGQAVSKYRFDHTVRPELSLAFLSYAPGSGLQVRAGRVGWDVFQLADTRNVGYSYLWVRPPVEFYGPLMISHLDGVDVAWTSLLGENRTLRLKASGGWAGEKLPLGEMPGHLNLGGSQVFGAMAEYQGPNLNFRLTYAQVRMAHDFPPPIADLKQALATYAEALDDPALARQSVELGIEGRIIRYSSLGMGWQQGPWKAECALAQTRSQSPLSPDSHSGYLSLSRKVGPVSPYAVVSRVTSSHAVAYVGDLPTLGDEALQVAQGVTAIVGNAHMNQTDLAVGVRWDLLPRAALKAQVDRIVADPSAPFLFPTSSTRWDGRMTIASVVLDFIF